jgi:hypothetical protein
MSYQEALGLAGSYVNDVLVCDDCGRPRGAFRCSCSFESPPPLFVQVERRYAVLPADGSHPIPYLSEMMARSFAAGYCGGQVTEDGIVIASYPVPAWASETQRKASAAAGLPLRPGAPRDREAA